MTIFSFHDPLFLLLLVVPALTVFLKLDHGRSPRILFSSVSVAEGLPASFRVISRGIVLGGLRFLALGLMVVALARPQQGLTHSRVHIEGIDIQLVLDISGSMQAADYIVNGRSKTRLDTVKKVVSDFIKKRPDDRIGMVVYASRPYASCPLTLDTGLLQQQLDETAIGMIDEDRTAIGSAIAAAVRRLKDSETKSKIIILMTDGNNNAGKISPEDAAEKLAKPLGIKIYTIGVGSDQKVKTGGGFFSQASYVEPLNEEPLRKISEVTGGSFFRATDTEGLVRIYNEINELEKTEQKVERFSEYRELFSFFLLVGLAMLVLEMTLRNTFYRTIP